MGCGTVRPMVKQYSNELELVEVINLHVDDLSEEDEKESSEGVKLNKDKIEIIYDEIDSPRKSNSPRKGDISSRNNMNLSPRKKNILHPAHNIFDDVDMSKSNLRNNKNVINPILVGADINNKELVKSYEQNDQDKEKDKQESQEFDENHQFERVFDHYKIISNVDAYRISEISVYSSHYICGIEIKYIVSSKKDGINKKEKISIHIGSAEPEYIETMKLVEGEDIEYIACSYSTKGVCSLTFKTNLHKILLAEADSEEGNKNFDLNLKDSNKVIVGLRTGFNEYMEYLCIYVALKLSIKEKLLLTNDT